MALTIFICYAREDLRFKEQLLTHLKPLEQIYAWHDGVIEPGEPWLPEIVSAIEACDVGIFLLSPHLLASDFIRKEELPRLRARPIKLLPALVMPCLIENSPFNEMQIVCRDTAIGSLGEADANAAWTEVARQVVAWSNQGVAKKTGPSGNKRNITHLPLPSATLVGRTRELGLLDECFADPGVTVAGIIAAGGVGKSALSWAWLEKLREKGYGGARMVFGWSFYSQGSRETQTNSDAFFKAALDFFGHSGEMPQTGEEKAEALAGLLDGQAFLLVLDGVEPLQYPPNVREGQFEDRGLYVLMRIFATTGFDNSLVLVSSRWEWQGIRSCRKIELGPVDEQDGVKLLNSLGVTKGLQEDFRNAVKEMAGHALALVLLGKLLAREQGGDISRRDCVKAGLFKNEHAKRVMAYYDTEVWPADAPQRAFLQLLGLFDRPMTRDAFLQLQKEADLAEPLRGMSRAGINGLASDLAATGLLQPGQDQWDAHPLVREYFGQTLEKNHLALFRQAHRVLFEFFSATKPHRPDTLEGLEPLYRAIHHGCKAGEYSKAFKDVLSERINRGEEYFSINKLGAIGAYLSVLTGFFISPWERVVDHKHLSDVDRAVLFSDASFCLMVLGRMDDAVVARQIHMAMVEQQKDWKEAYISAENLLDLLIHIGKLNDAQEVAEKGIDWADRSEQWDLQMSGRVYLAHAWHRQGDLVKSVLAFQEGEGIQKQHDSRNLFSIYGFRYCAMLLEQAQERQELEAVRKRGEEAQAIAMHFRWIREPAQDHLTQARALAGMGCDEEAGSHFDKAVSGIKKAGNIKNTPEILIYRAAFLRKQGELGKARLDLEEALEICVWSGMRLWEAEARLEEVHLLLDEKMREDAERALQRAVELIEGMPYPLRYGALRVARERFLTGGGESWGWRFLSVMRMRWRIIRIGFLRFLLH
ncbi:MAG: TIR domain-containing protein [Magnetococcales bacterium]|nr:TIR domain-containing protein [Magnetococcales bacterium]